MSLWVKTADVINLLEEEVPEETVPLNPEVFQIPEEEADEILTALGLPHLMHYLEWDEKKVFEHGLYGYKILKCRCSVCKKAKRQQAARYYRKVKGKKK